MYDLLRTDLKQQMLCLLLAFAPVAGLLAQCGEVPVFEEMPALVERSCNQATVADLANLPAGERCFEVRAGTGRPVFSSLSPALNAALLAGAGIPEATSVCGGRVEICVSDQVTGSAEACTSSLSFVRTYTARNLAVDATTAPALRAQTIRFLRPQLAQLEIEPVVTHIVPDTGDGLADNPPPGPDDYPFFSLSTGDTHLSADFCGYSVTYQDAERNTGCGNNFAFVRTFQIVDLCSDESMVFAQVVRVGDQQTVLSNPALQVENPIVFPANAGCFAVIDTRLNNILSQEDLCDNDGSLTAYVYLDARLTDAPLGPYDVFSGIHQSSLTDPLPLGRHLIRYIGQDSYGSPTTLDIDIEVNDVTPPVMVCETEVTVQLGANGQGRLSVTDLDGGTYDYCGDFTLNAARANNSGEPIGPFRPALNFYCDDAGEMPVLLQAIDATRYNRGRCLSFVNIIDGERPTCVAPPAVALNCQDFAASLPQDISAAFSNDPVSTGQLLDQSFGIAGGTDNCDSLRLRQSVRGELSDCGTGRLTRSFVVNDGAGFTQTDICLQQIDVLPYLEYSLYLPGDQNYTCATLPEPDDLIVGETGCDLLSVTIATDTLLTDASACYQLRRTYSIINWCEYDGSAASLEIPRRTDSPSASMFLHLEAGRDVSLADDRAVLDEDADPGNGTELQELVNGYGTSVSRGAFSYVQLVSVTDQEAPVVNVPVPDTGAAITEDCLGGIILSFTATDDCVVPETRIDLDINVVDRNGDDTLTRADFRNDRQVSDSRITGDPALGVEVFIRFLPIGQHFARVRTTDRCGNLTEQYVELNVRDGLGPRPFCSDINMIDLIPDPDFGGITSVIASDFITAPAAVCTPTEVAYAIYPEAQASQAGFVPEVDHQRLDFDCSDLGQNLLRVYAFSENSGLYDFCNILVEITTRDSTICEGRQGAISGQILTINGDPLTDTDVYARGQTDLLTETDDDGDYLFDGLKEERAFRVRPYSNRSPNNGLTTADITLVNDIILGINEPLSPYQLIAADVNNSGFVTVEDLFELRAVVLGTERNFSMTDSWRFLPADYVFPDPEDPWAENFPEEIIFDPLVGAQVADFVAIKVGDINGTARPSASRETGAVAGGRSTSTNVSLVLRADPVVPGRLSIFPPEGELLAGLQFSMQLPGGTIVSPGTVDSDAYRIDEKGVLHLIHLRTHESGLSADRPMVTLSVPSHNSAVPYLLPVSSALLPAEAYRPGGKALSLRAVGGPSFTATTVPVLASVYPNPVRENATLSFDWPKREIVVISFTDATGRMVGETTFPAEPGSNHYQFKATDLTGAESLYFMRILGSGGKAVVRVIRSAR